MEHFKHLMVVLMAGMAIALGASLLLLAHLATLVVVAFGSGLLMGLFSGIYLYRTIVKLFHKTP